jgi:hypothetical protein
VFFRDITKERFLAEMKTSKIQVTEGIVFEELWNKDSSLKFLLLVRNPSIDTPADPLGVRGEGGALMGPGLCLYSVVVYIMLTITYYIS